MFLDDYKNSALSLKESVLLECPEAAIDTLDEEISSDLFMEDCHLSDEVFDEDYMLYDESVVLDDYDSLKKASATIQKETTRLFKQIERRWGDDDRKCRTYYYRIRRKCLSRKEMIRKLRRQGYDATAVRYICNYELIKMIGNMIEIPNLEAIFRAVCKQVAYYFTGQGLNAYNLVVSRRLAATSQGQKLLNDYVKFLDDMVRECEKGMEKHSNGEDLNY